MAVENITVSSHDRNTIKTIDTTTGAIKYVRHVGGEIETGPVVSGDTVTVTVKEPQGKVTKVYKLPNLFLQKSFFLN